MAGVSANAPLAQAQVIVGHRGASYDAPENTVSAFREAWAQGADGVEGDFYLTKDDQIVCIHDTDTKRTAGRRLDVSTSTLAELRKLEYGSWKGSQFRGEPIPTLADVLGTVPTGKLLVIELKTGPEIVPFLEAELDRLQADRAHLLVIAFDKQTVAACKRQLPDVRAHWLTGYKQNRVTGRWSPSRDEVARTLANTGADGLGTQGNRQVVDAEFIQYLRHHGMGEFHVWTVDVPEDARYFQGLGAIGLTTNRPAFLRESIQ